MIALTLSLLLHMILFNLFQIQLGPMRKVNVPIEIEILAKPPIKKTVSPKPINPPAITKTTPKPVTQPEPISPGAIKPDPVPQDLPLPSPPVGAFEDPHRESIPGSPLIPSPKSIEREKPDEAISFLPSLPQGTPLEDPIYTPLLEVTKLPSFKVMIDPVYPQIAKRLEKEATVVVEVRISKTGNVLNVEVIQGAGYGFDESAIEAMKGSVFEPARIDDRPVAVVVRIPVRFRFKD